MKLVAVLLILLSCNLAVAQDWRDTLTMARKAYKLQDYSKAHQLYQKAQKGAPDDVDLTDEMGQSAYKAKKYAEAEKIFQQGQGTKTSNKEKANNLHNLGNSRMKSENYQGAVEAYQDALRLNPKDDKTRYNLSEAKRKLDQKKREEEKESDSNDQGNKDQKGDQGDQGNQDKKNQPSNSNQKKNNSDSKNGKGSPSQKNEGQLSDKAIDKMLQDLMRREAETKRRMNEYGGSGNASKSGKDW